MTSGASRWMSGAGYFLLAAAALCAGFFLHMPGRSAQYVPVSRAELQRAPHDGVVESGPIHWDIATYRSAPSLAPLRAFFEQNCTKLAGLDAAVCLANVFSSKFVEEEPTRDFFDHEYDPVEDLRAHLGGEAGHCVTRSGLSAATLLSVGVPARVVQLLGVGVPGHTVLEVWDVRWGWVLFDPTYGRLFETEGGPRSASAAFLDDVPGEWVLRGTPAVDHGVAFYGNLTAARADAAIRFPEPWLYTRTGPRLARWPYRVFFVHGGSFRWSEGRGQELLRPLILILSIAGVVAVGAGYRSRRRRSTELSVQAADEVAAA